ncbi:MAG: antibiotic biosynthesis monooxygenase [Erythrobacter sp.]|uniref:antibiotic biosynthesis monooxygenase family protein n=1 Tax=Erythrobacter sp. TaxID=1042 RepID=UPI003C72C31A
MKYKNGFVGIYRWKVDDEHVAAFRRAWSEGTEALKPYNSYGSLLGRAADGTFVAVAMWPDKETRDRAFEHAPDPDWPPLERLEPMLLEVLDDLWNVSPFRPD